MVNSDRSLLKNNAREFMIFFAGGHSYYDITLHIFYNN